MPTDNQLIQQKKVFLDHFAKMGNISRAARVAKITRMTVYNWQEHDDAFSTAFKQAERQAIEVLDAEAWRRAVSGVKKERRVYDRMGKLVDTSTETDYSDVLLMFLLKSRDRAKYGDPTRYNLEHSGPGGGAIAISRRPDFSQLTDDELDALEHLITKTALALPAGDSERTGEAAP